MSDRIKTLIIYLSPVCCEAGGGFFVYEVAPSPQCDRPDFVADYAGRDPLGVCSSLPHLCPLNPELRNKSGVRTEAFASARTTTRLHTYRGDCLGTVEIQNHYGSRGLIALPF